MLIDRKIRNKMEYNQPMIIIYMFFIIFVLLFLVVQNSKPNGSVNIILFGDEEKTRREACPVKY
tara:strand:+ start:376 stop:567 length:192 start_codon:yes stop_codon:yes gene_type:complete